MQRERGFTMAEMMAAIVVLTLVITTSLAVFTERTRRMQQASETILAWQALSNEAELLRRVDFNDLRPGQPKPFDPEPSILAPLRPFTATYDVQPSGASLRRVEMTIRWKNGKREAKLALIRTDTGGSNLW